MLDPKNYTIEPWILGGGTIKPLKPPTLAGFARGFLLSQTIAFAGVGLVGAIFDPLDVNEGGLIPDYRENFNPDYGEDTYLNVSMGWM